MQKVDQESCLLETNRRLSKSLLWRLQRNYFERQGIDAWRSGTVPHHITSSPFIADAYARVVMGFLRDWNSSLDYSQPVHIVELGSGSGRFAYSFLKKFLRRHRSSVLKDIPVKYVMTDFTKSNLDYWRTHPWLLPLIEAGSLDFARFDLESDVQLELLHSGEMLLNETLRNPLVVIANYVFDSTPQDAFVCADEKLFEILVSLTPQKEIDTGDTGSLSSVEFSTHENLVNGNYYDDPKWNRILLDYKQRLDDTAFLFPTSALHCIRNLHCLSGGRMLLLSGDRGYSHDDALKLGSGILDFAVHGSFCMMVDYQIIGEYGRQLGGQVLHPAKQAESLNISAFLFGDPADDFVETNQAYDEAIEKFGPDDFFTLKEGIAEHYDALNLDQILAFLRLSCWDYKRFGECLPVLKEHLPDITNVQKKQLHETIMKVWDSYLPIGEEDDLAFQLGTLLLEIDYYAEALELLQHSVDLYGMAPGTAYNMGVCCYGLGQMEQALGYVNHALQLDPELETAITLRAQLRTVVPAMTVRRARRKVFGRSPHGHYRQTNVSVRAMRSP